MTFSPLEFTLCFALPIPYIYQEHRGVYKCIRLYLCLVNAKKEFQYCNLSILYDSKLIEINLVFSFTSVEFLRRRQ